MAWSELRATRLLHRSLEAGETIDLAATGRTLSDDEPDLKRLGATLLLGGVGAVVIVGRARQAFTVAVTNRRVIFGERRLLGGARVAFGAMRDGVAARFVGDVGEGMGQVAVQFVFPTGNRLSLTFGPLSRARARRFETLLGR